MKTGIIKYYSGLKCDIFFYVWNLWDDLFNHILDFERSKKYKKSLQCFFFESVYTISIGGLFIKGDF